MSKISLMSHLVAGYPTDELSFTAARALVDGGADILEIQLPFSDPSADGPAIQGACTKVLQRGYKTADGLAFIARLHKEFPQVKIYLMSYGSLVYTPSVENFCKRAAAAGYEMPQSYEGIRLSFKGDDVQGWMLLRLSLHDPVMPLNIEGARKGDLAKLVEIARKLTDGFDRLDRSCLK